MVWTNRTRWNWRPLAVVAYSVHRQNGALFTALKHSRRLRTGRATTRSFAHCRSQCMTRLTTDGVGCCWTHLGTTCQSLTRFSLSSMAWPVSAPHTPFPAKRPARLRPDAIGAFACAALKLNVLHWHLTDSQSFSFGSMAHPELPAFGAFAPAAVYSRAEMAAVVSAARARGIRVVPELDMPAHTASWAHGQPGVVVSCPARVAADEEGLEHGVDKVPAAVISL